MKQGVRVAAIVGALLVFTSCMDATAPPPRLELERGNGPSFDNEYIYEDSYLTVTNDGWEPDLSFASEEIEIFAADQTGSATDGRRECPVDQFYIARAPLRKIVNGEILDFVFRGPFEFVRHVSRDGSSPWPTAIYRFRSRSYTTDNRYYAPEGNTVLLACDGRYRWNNSFARVWSGHLYGRTYNGPIVRNYTASAGGETCGFGYSGEETATYENGSSSPAPEPDPCAGSAGGSRGEEPLAEDEWYAWYEGIRFRCHRVQDETGGNVISCTVDDGS